MSTGLASRHSAYQLLNQVIHLGNSLDHAIEHAAHWPDLSESDKAFTYNLTMEVLRHYGECRRFIAEYVHKPLQDSVIGANIILAMGMVQIISLNTPAHAVVNTSVSLAKTVGCEAVAGLINAVLKKVVKANHIFDNPTANLPSWMRKSWQKAYGDEIVNRMTAVAMQPPPLDITVKHAPELWAQKLGGTHIYGHTVRLSKATDVASLDGYAQGEWWVQDVAATLPAMLLGDVGDKQVLDLCAAPGGKTAQLVHAGAQVTAIDRSPARMKRLLANMQRLNMAVKTQVADIMHWEPTQQYDAILLDAPCSATGTLRRHPDMLYIRKKEEIAELAALQTALITRASQWLKPGGVMVYAICSLQPPEATPVIESTIKACNYLEIAPVTSEQLIGIEADITEEGFVRTLPSHLLAQGGMDGFFIARLQKS